MRKGVLGIIAGIVLSAAVPPVSQAADFVPGEVIVSIRHDGIRHTAADLPGVESAAPVGELEDIRLLDLEPGERVSAVAARLESRPEVAYAQPNWIYNLHALPNDPMFGQLWGLRNRGQNVSTFNAVNIFGIKAIDSGAFDAWKTRTGGKRTVGVIDTGISKDHPDLKRNLDRKLSRNFVSPYRGGVVDPKDWDDTHGHGTHVAGTIGAVGDNGLGVVGVNWRTRLVALRVCNANAECDSAAMAAAIDYAGRKEIGVLNMSIGSDPDEPFSENRVVVEAIRRHSRTLLVNSAGNESNDNDRHPEWPCSSAVRNLICVAAIDQRGKLATYSDWGRKTVDLAAPGSYITSTWANKVYPFDKVFFRDGTAGWNTPGWQETISEGFPVLQFEGNAAETYAQPDGTIDLTGMRHCRINADLAGHLAGNQTVIAQYRRDGGAWTDAAGRLAAGDLKAESADAFFFAGGAGGSGKVEIRLLYRSGGTTSPAPLLTLSGANIICIGKMPPGGTYNQLEGTSMASPHVAGTAILVQSAYPKLRGTKLKRVLMGTTVKMKSLRGKTVTGGRLDAGRALRKARQIKFRDRRRG